MIKVFVKYQNFVQVGEAGASPLAYSHCSACLVVAVAGLDYFWWPCYQGNVVLLNYYLLEEEEMKIASEVGVGQQMICCSSREVEQSYWKVEEASFLLVYFLYYYAVVFVGELEAH